MYSCFFSLKFFIQIFNIPIRITIYVFSFLAFMLYFYKNKVGQTDLYTILDLNPYHPSLTILLQVGSSSTIFFPSCRGTLSLMNLLKKRMMFVTNEWLIRLEVGVGVVVIRDSSRDEKKYFKLLLK